MNIVDLKIANDPIIEAKNREYYELEKPKILDVICEYRSMHGEIPSLYDSRLDEKLRPILENQKCWDSNPIATFLFTVNELLDIKELYRGRSWIQ
ncbi:MAG: hypothetical protein ACXAEU_13530 [Candidatus Hodarchaeales archaeon]|jgi:hypothetical protein